MCLTDVSCLSNEFIFTELTGAVTVRNTVRVYSGHRNTFFTDGSDIFKDQILFGKAHS